MFPSQELTSTSAFFDSVDDSVEAFACDTLFGADFVIDGFATETAFEGDGDGAKAGVVLGEDGYCFGATGPV